MAEVVHGGRAPATITDSHSAADGLRVGGLSLLWCVCRGRGSEICVRYPGSPHGQAAPSSSVSVSRNLGCGLGEEGRNWQTGSISQLRGGGCSPQGSRAGSPRLCEALGGCHSPTCGECPPTGKVGPVRCQGLWDKFPPEVVP